MTKEIDKSMYTIYLQAMPSTAALEKNQLIQELFGVKNIVFHAQ